MVFPHGLSLSINTRVITLVRTLYRALGMFKEGHQYFQGCNLLLQWWILSHLAKGAGTREQHTLDNKNTLKDLNDLLYWENMNNQRTRGRWAQTFSKLREENLQWMLDHFISKEVVVESRGKLWKCCSSSTRYSVNLPLRTISSLATVPKKTNYTQRSVLWCLCVRYWRS